MNKKDSENQTTLYWYKQRKYKVETKTNKEASKKEIEQKDRCASKVVVVGSSNELSSHPFPVASEWEDLLFHEEQLL